MTKHQRKRDSGPGRPGGRPLVPARWLQRGSGPVRWVQITVLVWLVLAVLYPGAMFEGEVFSSSDASNSEAFTGVGDASLAAGHYPLWNPYLFAGMPSFGSLAYVRFLYPPAVVFNFLQDSLGFGPLTWMLAHLLLGGVGMAWLLSRWKLPTACLMLGVVIWLLFPKVVAWGVHGHGSKLGAAMYLPWITGWALRVLDGAGRRAVAMVGLLLGLQFLRGHVQITYYTLGVVAWLGLWSAVWPLDEAWRAVAARTRWLRLGALALAVGLGFLIGAILLVPVHDYAGISIRGQDTAGGGGVGLDYATGWSLSPRETGTFVMPWAAGFGKATYLGLMPFNDYPNYFGFLILVLAALAFGRSDRRWPAVLLALSLLAVLVSFGQGFYELLYRWLPFFNKFRVPSMILIMVAFCLALLAPRGLDSWVRRPPGRGLPVVSMVLGLLGLLLLLGGGLSLFREGFLGQLQSLAAAAGRQTAPILLQEAWHGARGSTVRIGLILLTGAAAFWLARGNPGFRARGLAWVIVLLVALDLGGVDRGITNPERSLFEVGRDASGLARLLPAGPLAHKPVPNRAAPAPQASLVLEAVGHGRIWPLGADAGRNTWMTAGIRSLGGYHPAKLARYEPIRQRLSSEQPAGRVASWLSARLVSYDRRFQAQEIALLGEMGLDLSPQPLNTQPPFFYENRAALPRARLAEGWLPAQQAPGGGLLEPFLDALQGGSLGLARPVFLDQDPGIGLAAGPVPAAGEVPLVPAFLVDGLDEVVLTIRTSAPAVLVLADMAAPGWKVEVDGQPRPLLTADLVLRGVGLEPGTHQVRFHYSDPSVRKGLTLSLAGLILAASLLVPWRRRGSSTPQTGVSSAHE